MRAKRPMSAAGCTMKTGLEPHAMPWKGSWASRTVAYSRDLEAESLRSGRVTLRGSSITARAALNGHES